METAYISIDLKSFYASVECVERELDPLRTNLVVADESRTEKTICLAVSPSLKAYGIPGRPRLFEVVQRIKAVNEQRKYKLRGRELIGSSVHDVELKGNPRLAVSYIVAPPRMALYMEYSMKIYQIYLKYIAPEDIHAYSVDEVFIDVTHYLKTYNMTPREIAMMIIRDVLKTTGITATAGIGTNLYLAKVAMDISAKHMPADKDGVRIAQLDEISYRKQLWEHTPITDFWRVGKGYADKLAKVGLNTMGDVARCSLGTEKDYYNEDLLYKLFGINAELLIDHAWGWEPVGIAEIKAYKPSTNSISSGQVLQCPYDNETARLVVWEMADILALDLVDKGLVTDQMVLTVGYDIESTKGYKGEITIDRYGRKIPKHAHGTINLKRQTSSAKLIAEAVVKLYDRITDKNLLVRRITVVANKVIREKDMSEVFEQLEFFTDNDSAEKEKQSLEREKNMQKAILDIKKKFGKNAVLKGSNLKEGATAKNRNKQIGGHKA